MRKLLIILAVALASPLAGQKPAPVRDDLAAIEKSIDDKLKHFDVAQPLDLLGLTRGVYLKGYGAVFTAEMGLLQAPMISPFRPKVSKDEALQIRATKQKRVPEIRKLMREMLLASAASLDSLPPGEQIVLGVSFIYSSWEDVSGLPKSILMQAQRSQLLEITMARQPKSALDTMIQMREE